MEGSAIHRRPCYPTYTPSHWHPALVFVASLLGCGGAVGSGPPPPPPQITVTVSPPAATILLGTTKTFAATVSNTTNTSVSWGVNGVTGGYAAAGTIDANGRYTAPGILPSPASVSIQAISAADNSKSSAVDVTIASDISVTIAPAASSVELGAAQAFTATVQSSGSPNRSVTWNVTGSGCSGAGYGTVDSSGNYTAPPILPAPASVSLVATSVADPSKSASAAITVTSTFSLAVNGPSSLNADGTVNYSAAVTPAANSNPSRAITWSVARPGCSGTDCGTISASGAYTAPALPPISGPVQITATPQADPSKAVTLAVTIMMVVNVSITPSSATLFFGGMQSFQATVTGARDSSVTWFVDGALGGSAATGTILNSQTNPDATIYTAPAISPPGGMVTVQAKSNADPSVSGSATIAIESGITVALSPSTATLAINRCVRPWSAIERG